LVSAPATPRSKPVKAIQCGLGGQVANRTTGSRVVAHGDIFGVSGRDMLAPLVAGSATRRCWRSVTRLHRHTDREGETAAQQRLRDTGLAIEVLSQYATTAITQQALVCSYALLPETQAPAAAGVIASHTPEPTQPPIAGL
jgi:hypothetical protein